MNVAGFLLLAIILINVGIFLYASGFFTNPGGFDISPGTINPPDSVYGEATSTNKNQTSSGTGSSAGTSVKTTIDPAEIPAGFTKDQLSAYFHKVRFDRVNPGANNEPENITLISNITGSQTIDVTGWVVQANRASQVIPQAVRTLDVLRPSLAGDIVIAAGDILNIYGTGSPIGANFRLNRCSGYLQDRFNFIPELPRDCPAIQRSDIVAFTGSCQDYLLNLPSCREPVASAVPPNDSLCRYFINNLNYLGCVDRYKNTAAFLKNEWRVWLGNNFIDNLHDRLLLLDKSGKLVDLYIF